jgi:acetyl esterase/lipase
MTVYSPIGESTGAGVVVFPGGGYSILAIDLEGTEVCDWLTIKGITCVLLKYRVPGVGLEPRSGPYPKSPMALEDAQRTVGLVRFHAAEWHIDPHRIGVLGFSAGGHLVAAISTHFEHRLYQAVDAADKESCRPDFAVAVYPGHLPLADNSIALNPDIANHITHQTPPTFLLQNEDDHVDRVEDSLSYYAALKKAGIPVELHSYAQGGHAFWTPADEVSRNRLASADGDLAWIDRDTPGIGAVDPQRTSCILAQSWRHLEKFKTGIGWQSQPCGGHCGLLLCVCFHNTGTTDGGEDGETVRGRGKRRVATGRREL